ncbi:MAG: PAS domain-containing protein, partial [Candidatus Cloacimonetes bacterium]|nr:PAS domain-containing protein [Candidatus Cloacimonadota bacterium]
QFTLEQPILKHESIIKKDGIHYMHIEWTIHAFFDKNGKLSELQSVGRDITEHKRIQYRLRKSEEQLELALEGGDLGLWDFYPQTDRMEVNTRLINILGYKVNEIEDTLQFWLSIVHPSDIEEVLTKLNKHIIGETPSFDAQFGIKHKQGNWVWIINRGKVLEWDNNRKATRLCGTVIDQTQRIELELQKRIIDKKHSELIENMNTSVVVCKAIEDGKEFIILEANPAALKSIGLEFDAVKERELKKILPGIEEMGMHQVLQEVYKTGKPQKVINSRYDDGRLFIIIDYYAFKLQSGEIVVVYEDITEWLLSKEEIKELNRNLEQRVQERTIQLEATNQELQSFAYSISHDLRAPLRAIIGFSEAVLEDYPDLLPQDGVEHLKRVSSEGKRMSLLIDELLKLSRMNKYEIQYQYCNLSEIVSDIAKRVMGYYSLDIAKMSEYITIQENVIAKGDLTLLSQAVENILDNAFKFTSKNPSPHIKFSYSNINDRNIYCIEDNGVGFDMHYSDKVFAPFQRLHSVHEFEGTGIGLAIVKRVIVKHGGRIWCESEIGKGTKIFFTLGDFDF